ncbi:hypothetical protein KSP39_PZI006495 [Platanthera zijinensis]|uniref:Uncharacterized protein n=1 Tax=Platanthera zijinensis TaxID=2320716 RepID=A0AAP0GAD4_9ASPA
MEFVDDDARPRFLLKGRSTHSSSSPPPETLKISKIHASFCFSAAAAFLITALSLSSYTSIPFTLLIWFSLSLLLAPFAPPSLTGGDPRVGRGDPLPPPAPKSAEPNEPRKRSAARWNPKPPPPPPPPPLSSPCETLINKPEEKQGSDPSGHTIESPIQQEEEWTSEDFEILKRQISKHPAGAPGRWERVAGAFKGRRGVESVIRAAKSLSEKGPPGGADSFAQFLKQRKPLDRRVDDHANGDPIAGNGGWSSGEDITLLNALKAFPKDAEMRWEKVAAAVPGKSKAECIKRAAELKRDFRSSKSSES